MPPGLWLAIGTVSAPVNVGCGPLESLPPRQSLLSLGWGAEPPDGSLYEYIWYPSCQISDSNTERLVPRLTFPQPHICLIQTLHDLTLISTLPSGFDFVIHHLLRLISSHHCFWLLLRTSFPSADICFDFFCTSTPSAPSSSQLGFQTIQPTVP